MVARYCILVWTVLPGTAIFGSIRCCTWGAHTWPHRGAGLLVWRHLRFLLVAPAAARQWVLAGVSSAAPQPRPHRGVHLILQAPGRDTRRFGYYQLLRVFRAGRHGRSRRLDLPLRGSRRILLPANLPRPSSAATSLSGPSTTPFTISSMCTATTTATLPGGTGCLAPLRRPTSLCPPAGFRATTSGGCGRCSRFAMCAPRRNTYCKEPPITATCKKSCRIGRLFYGLLLD